MNIVNLLGRLTKDIEVKYTANTKMAIANFSLAVNRNYKVKDGEPNADFVPCMVFSKTAENMAKFFKKGDLVVIRGHITTGSYEKDGNKVYTTNVTVESFEFVPNNRIADASGGDTVLPSNDFLNAIGAARNESQQNGNDGFMNIPDGSGFDLPFA